MASGLAEMRDPGHRYAALGPVEQGSSGRAFLAHDLAGGGVVAVQVVQRDGAAGSVGAEVERRRGLRHPHVLLLKEAFTIPGAVCVVMEHTSGGSLLQLLEHEGRLAEPLARYLFQQLVVAVDYCHRAGAAGLGLTLRGTMLQDVPQLPVPLVKIAALGERAERAIAPPAGDDAAVLLTAPELRLGGQLGAARGGEAADVWACGVMLYAMVCGRYPSELLLPGGAAAPAPRVSPRCRHLLRRMLAADPARRIQITEILAHPWFLTGLPPTALAMNDTYVRLRPPPPPRDFMGAEVPARGPYDAQNVASCCGALFLALQLSRAALGP